MTHDEIIDGLHMASGIVQNRRTLLQGETHGRDMSPTELCLDSSYTSAIDACAAATTEIQRLGAQLAEIQAQEPAARQSRFKDSSELRRLRAERDAARLAADKMATQLAMKMPVPVLEIRACGCGAAKNGRCVMGDYGVLPIGAQLYAGQAAAAAPERAQSPISRDGVNVNPPPSYPKPPAPPPAPAVRRGHDAASAQTCRCGPDGCSDSTSCPKGGAA